MYDACSSLQVARCRLHVCCGVGEKGWACKPNDPSQSSCCGLSLMLLHMFCFLGDETLVLFFCVCNFYYTLREVQRRRLCLPQRVMTLLSFNTGHRHHSFGRYHPSLPDYSRSLRFLFVLLSIASMRKQPDNAKEFITKKSKQEEMSATDDISKEN